MTRTDNSTLDSHSTFSVARLAWVILIPATLYICYFHNLGAIGLVGPDEPRYAWIARDMAESGDWITPRLYGKPWFEKPVLYYWAAALSFKLFGVSEVTARFPSALAALFATLAMAWLAWRTYGAETARWLLLLLPTTVGMIGFSHAAATDMPFAAMLTIAMVFAGIVLGLVRDQNSPILPRIPWLALILFGFFLGLAVLAKGPAAIILSGGAVLLWAALTKRRRDAFRCLHPVAIASFCLTAFPWYIVCAQRNPDFFRIFIIEHNFKRFLTPEFQHIQPFWFYLPVLLVAFVPWTLALLWSALSGFLRNLPVRRPNPTTILLLCWPFFCFVFFSVSKSKLPGYILPAVPAIGLLLAHSLLHLVPQDEKTFRWLHFGFCFLSVSAALLLLQMGPNFYTSPITGKAMTSSGWVLLLFALANLSLAFRPSVNSHAVGIDAACVVPVLVLLLVFPQISAPWLRYDPSGKTLATELNAAHIPPTEIYTASMQRGQQYSLSFYLHHEIQAWDPDGSKGGYLLVRSRNCNYFVKLPAVCMMDPVELRNSGWFVYRIQRNDLVSGLNRFDGLLRSSSGNSNDRQPR